MINSFVYGQEINSLDFLFKNPDKVTISTIFFQDKTTYSKRQYFRYLYLHTNS